MGSIPIFGFVFVTTATLSGIFSILC
jgi:hypothetical protein